MAQPQIVYPQNPLNSKTILINVFGSAITWVVTKYGLKAIFDPDTVNQIATALALAVMGGINVVIRKYTAGPLSFSAPLTQPPPQDLPTGTVAVTTPHPGIGGSAAVVALQPGDHSISVPVPPQPNPQPPAVSVSILPAPVAAPPAPPGPV